MFSGVVAGAVEAVVTMPFEVTKTTQQLGKSGSVLEGLRAVRERGGLRGLYSGLSLQLVQSGGKVGVRFGVYNTLSNFAGENKRLRTVSGFAAGCIESLVWIAPCERLKILRIKNADKPLSETLLHARREGILRLWTGASPTVVRNGATVGLRFYLYEKVIDSICRGNAALAGALVGAIGTLLNNPVDVVKSEMQAAQGDRRYSSMTACVRHVVTEKGWRHLLTAGLSARILKISIGQATIFQVVAWMS